MTNTDRALMKRIDDLSATINADHSILPYGSDQLWDLIKKKHHAGAEIQQLLGKPLFLNMAMSVDSPVCRHQECWKLPNGEVLIVGNELDEGWQRCVRHPADFLEEIEREARKRGKSSTWNGLQKGQFYSGGWFLPG